MFRFAQPIFLYALLVIPVLAAGFFVQTRRKRRQLAELGDPALMAALMPNVSRVRPVVKFCLQMAALACVIIALARPQFGTREQTVRRKGIEVMVALDVSNSMLAQDVVPNRLERSKQILSKMLDGMTDDKVGLVVFAGDAYVQLPITCDYVSAKMFLSQINPSMVPRQGTAIGAAIRMCDNSFGELAEGTSHAIVLITDGENHEDDAVGAAKAAKDKGIDIFVIGIGKPEGSPIPTNASGTSFHKDRSGNVVVSKLNEQMCREIAQAGGGTYVRADNSNTALRTLLNQIDKLAKSEMESKVYSDYNEQYQSFVVLALLFLLADFFLFSRKNKRLGRLRLFEPTQK